MLTCPTHVHNSKVTARAHQPSVAGGAKVSPTTQIIRTTVEGGRPHARVHYRQDDETLNDTDPVVITCSFHVDMVVTQSVTFHD